MSIVTSYGTIGTENGVVLRNLFGKDYGKGVVTAHGRGGTGVDALFSPLITAMGNMFPAISTDLAGTTAWGNDAAVTKFNDAKTELQANWGASSGQVLLYGFSMGALAVLRWALANPSSVAAIAIAMGVVDLVYEHDQNVQGWASEIETAHGVSGTYAGNATITARDPIQNTAALAALPIKFWYASNDTSAITARQQAFITATGCESVNLGPVGHNSSAVPVDQVIAFFSSHA